MRVKYKAGVLVFLMAASLGFVSVAGAQVVVTKPVKLSIIDVAGNLQLSKTAIEAFKAANPKLVSDIEYLKLTAPELPAKIKAQQMAGNLDTTMVFTGYDAMAAGVDQDIYEQLMPQYFRRRAERRGWTKPPDSERPRVAYFVDVFANFNDPLLGEAVMAVLQHHGIDVYVPPEQIGCGMAPLAQGDVETAREVAQANLRILAEVAREGYPIICSEPTAALMLQQDYLQLVDDEDAQLVADQTVELTNFLWELHQQGRLKTDFQPLGFTVGHHVPCHLKALGHPAAGPQLLRLIPGLRTHTIDVSCSGMAGTFGLKAENYALSLEAGRPMLQEFAQPWIRYGSTECSTCRLQMEDGGSKRTLHPVQYLALAYGLMPGLAKRLEEPIGELVLR